MRVWELDPAATLPVLRGHTSYVYPVAYSPDSHWIASGGWDNTLRLWDATTGEPCGTFPYPRVLPCLAYGPDGRWLVSAADGAAGLRIWDTATARVRKEFPGPPGSLVVAIRSAPNNLDPRFGTDEASQRVSQLVYASLMDIGDDLRVKPTLAERPAPHSRLSRRAATPIRLSPSTRRQ